jgi:ABC-type Na+ efflux pump permease subunit
VSDWLRVACAGFRLELQHFARSRLFVALTVLAAVNFLVLVSLFGVTGSRAPTAIINLDRGPYGAAFIHALEQAHHSFRLEPMAAADAADHLQSGTLVATITIPAAFSEDIRAGEQAPLQVAIDNIDIDLTDDIQRALPSAIVAFGREQNFPNIAITADEHDLLAHDTDYIPYLVVSGLALDALVIAGILGAWVVAREWEGGASKTWKVWRLAPSSPSALLAGKLAAAAALSAVALAATTLVVIGCYGVVPQQPLALVAVLGACVVLFSCLGGLLGALVRRTQPVVPLVFGLAMPFYLNSGALEPARFDGEKLWRLAHISPCYYAVGALEAAVHGLRVTPESPQFDMLVLAAMAAVSLVLARLAIVRSSAR